MENYSPLLLFWPERILNDKTLTYSHSRRNQTEAAQKGF